MHYRTLFLSFLLAAGLSAKAQTAADSTGLPGDNFDLYGALDLFKQSSSPEDFEKKINDPANQVNNLDLDGDGNVDYVRVIDNVDGDAHALQLQVAVSASEKQDVAVVEVEKNGSESADLQIVGDEELYGKDYIVEAQTEESTPDQHWQNFRPVVVVNVWTWPCVRYVYAPAYVVWVSPWYWGYYPAYWHPWHPVLWRVHYGHVMRYHHPYYHCVHVHRVMRAHEVYSHHRQASPAVHRRYEADHQRRENPSGKATGKQAPSSRNSGKAGKGGAQQKGGSHQKQGNASKNSGGQRKGGNGGAPKNSGGQHRGGGGGGQHKGGHR